MILFLNSPNRGGAVAFISRGATVLNYIQVVYLKN